MSQNNDPLTKSDISALESVLDLIKGFLDKNPIKKKKLTYKKVKLILDEIKEGGDSQNTLFKKAIDKLKSILKREIYPNIYYFVGGHGGIIIDGVGFCEFDDPKFAMERLLDKMKLALETNMPYNIEIAISCLEWVANKYPKLIDDFKRLFKQGRFEIINPAYSQPYNLIIGPESNIKQFEYGLQVLKQLGLECNVYYCSESSLHPQIPQLLKGFGIEFGSLRTRLLGTAPITPTGHINWIGLDNTSVETITDQAGVFNGEYWHGTFFQEIPNLLFQAVAKPFMENIVYSSIEDFVMPLPYQEAVWRISRFGNVLGQFSLCSEFLQSSHINGEYKFPRDFFSLGNYIFIASDLFLNNKNCEVILITAEILNTVLGIYNEDSKDSFFEQAWTDLLLTQAHDNYAVPFIHPGDYSAQQLSKEEYKKLNLPAKGMAISELSLQLHKKIYMRCEKFIDWGLWKLASHLGLKKNKSEDSSEVLIFNPTPIPRKDIVSIPPKMKFIAEVPPLGYKIYPLEGNNPIISTAPNDFLYDIQLQDDLKTISVNYEGKLVYNLKFTCDSEYKLTITDKIQNYFEDTRIFLGELKNQTFTLKITQYQSINRLEFELESNGLKEIILEPTISIKRSIINYPFGIEQTKRTKIQTLDFLWLAGEALGIIYMIKNSQQFLIDRKNFVIRNLIHPRGRFEFALTVTEEKKMISILDHVNSYQFRLYGIKLNQAYDFLENSGSFLSLNPPIKLINLWRRSNHVYCRAFNPCNSKQIFKIESPLITKNIRRIDFNYNDLKVFDDRSLEIDPWGILTLKFE